MTTAFRPFPAFTVFLDSQGAPLAGGRIEFFDTGTINERVVYGDKALTINNGDTLTLDSAGRLTVGDCWASGSYRVRLYSADNVLIDEYEDVEIPGGTGTVLPTLAADEFITSDGAVLVATTIREVPDPTGQANKVLSTDGTVYTWIAKPADGADSTSTTDTATGFTVGTQALVTGTDSAPNVGGKSTSKAVTFATAFASTPIFIGIEPTGSAYSPSGGVPAYTITARSATGFTVTFTLGEQDDTQASYNFNATVPFNYVAVGVKV